MGLFENIVSFADIMGVPLSTSKYARFAEVQKENMAVAGLRHGGHGDGSVVRRPDNATILADDAKILGDQPVMAFQRLDIDARAVFHRRRRNSRRPGKAVGPGQKIGAEPLSMPGVVHMRPLAQIPGAGPTVRQIHAGVDGGRQPLALGPLAKGERGVLAAAHGTKHEVEILGRQAHHGQPGPGTFRQRQGQFGKGQAVLLLPGDDGGLAGFRRGGRAGSRGGFLRRGRDGCRRAFRPHRQGRPGAQAEQPAEKERLSAAPQQAGEAAAGSGAGRTAERPP